MKTLVIDKESIFKVKVEARETFSSSFFSDIYTKADKILKEISDNSDKNVSGEINNIIAFVGERGAGKTSAMISFANSLERHKYEILKTIDPSVFSKSDSIIEIIVAEMFRKFKDFKNNCDESQQDRPALMKQFQKVYKGLRILNSNKFDIYKEHEDDLEVLIDLTSGISLKLQLEELIKGYLKYIGKKILVISIDDLDMNIANGDKMLEDIRKYLLLHKVVILMAVKIEQMKDSVQQKYITDFNNLIHYNINKNDEEEELNFKFMANKYIEKIIPVERRLVLPRVNDSDIDHIQVNIGIEEEFKNIRELIKIKLFEKLNIIMLFDDQNDKLIPQNLRGIIDLVKILYSMENIDQHFDECSFRKIKTEKLKSNINIFKSYILYDWCNDHVKYSYNEFLKEIDEVKPELMNKRIVYYLGDKIVEILRNDEENKGYSSLLRGKNRESELLAYAKTISDRDVNYKNISIGDVNTCLYAYDKITFEEEIKKFILALKILYTLKLLKLRYCEQNGDERIKNVFAGDCFGEYFYLTKNRNYNNLLNSDLKVKNSSLLIKVNKKHFPLEKYMLNKQYSDSVDQDYISIKELIEDLVMMEKNKDYIKKKYENRIDELKISEVYESEIYETKDEETRKCEEVINVIGNDKILRDITYLYSLIVPQGSIKYLRDRCFEYEILKLNKTYYDNFYFKPLNILSLYIYLDDIKNRILNVKNEGDNDNIEEIKNHNKIINDKVKNILVDLIINQDFFMKITENLDYEINKLRINKEGCNSKIIEKIIVKAVEVINDLLNKVKLGKYENLKNIINKNINKEEFWKLDNKFIDDNIFISEGYLGYFDSKQESLLEVMEKLDEIGEYLCERGIYNAGVTINSKVKKAIDNIEEIISKDKSLKYIRSILSTYEEEIRVARLELGKTDSSSIDRKNKLDYLIELMSELRYKIEKGA